MRQLSFEEQQKLDSLAAAYDEQVDSGRQLVQRIGRPLDADFDERVYLGTGTAPPTGSFASDTFTDTDGTAITSPHGRGWRDVDSGRHREHRLRDR